MKKHFVTFYSPGTFVSETDEYPIDSWDVDKAVELSKKINQRYGAKPYGFRFSTRSRGSQDLDSKESKSSGVYYLGGEVFTIEDIRKRNKKDEKILLSNMECNKIDKIIVNTNSYRFTGELKKNDVVLDMSKYDPTKKKESKKLNLRKKDED